MRQASVMKQTPARKETQAVAEQPTYLANFRLREAPFQPEPDARFLYLSQAHARAQAYMEAAPAAGDPFVVITGVAGTGKSLLALALRQELGTQALVMHCAAAPATPRELLQLLLDQCGFLPFRGEWEALLSTLTDHLAKQRAAGRRALLLFDDAHAAEASVLAELAELAGAAEDGSCLLHTALIGLPLLEQRLAAPEVAALAARLRLRVQLTAFTSEQTRAYIVHRLAIAGSQGREIFEPAAFEAVHRHTGGIPRQINMLCDAALRATAKAGRDLANADDVVAAARELQWPELPAATAAPATDNAPPASGASAHHLTAQRGTDAAAAAVGRLRVQLGGQVVAEHDLYRGRTMIGRASDADLRIDDRTISRHHCQVICTDDHSVIQDLNSTNGVYVNDRRVRRHLLDDGEVFVLGAYQVAYSNLRSAAGASNPRAKAMLESEGEATQH
jgi:general secretion pathway protein A